MIFRHARTRLRIKININKVNNEFDIITQNNLFCFYLQFPPLVSDGFRLLLLLDRRSLN